MCLRGLCPSRPNVAFGSQTAVSRDDRHVRTWEKADISDSYPEIYPPDVRYQGLSRRSFQPG